jgi:uncharacterized protein YuzE
MKISYDAKVDAIYFRFIDGPCQVTTQRLTEDIAVNYDSKGDVVGIEILSAQEHLKFYGKKPIVIIENLQFT